MLNEQRRNAIDRAILESLSGDAPAALRAIAVAEGDGVDAGRLNMLRGLVERINGRTPEALVYLEQAERQHPESVAVKALLASTYGEGGQFERYDEMLPLLEGLSPETSEDHLFLTLALANPEPAKALRILDRAPASSRQSSVARLIRAQVQGYLADMTARIDDTEVVLAALDRVELPDNPLFLQARIHACLTAARVYGPGHPRREDVLGRAARDAASLLDYPENPIPVSTRCHYFHALGDDDALLVEVARAREKTVYLPYGNLYAAAVLYRRKQFVETLDLVRATDATGDTFRRIAEGWTLAAIPGRKEEARQAFEKAIRNCRGGGVLSYVTAALPMLGTEYRVEARKAAREIRDRDAARIPDVRDRWYHHLLDFHTGLISAEELMTLAGESRFNQCEGYFYVALDWLAQGRRDEARIALARSLESGITYYHEYICRRAFLAVIDDPDWMPWIPMEPEEPTSGEERRDVRTY